MNQDVFEKYSVPKAVATLALPSVIGMLVTIFYNMADTFFVGQTGDPNQVAAVSLATPVFLLLMAVGNIFGIGGCAFISRTLGEGNKEKVKHISSFCFYGGITAGLVMMAAFLFGMQGILKAIGCSENTIGFAEDYLKYIAIGGVFVVVATAFNNIVRGEGAAKISMIGMMMGTIVNIILDPILILGLNMGVAGAAIATVIGNLCSVLFYLYYFLKKHTILSISPKHFTLKEGMIGGVCSAGIPASVNNILMSASNIILNIFLVSYGDDPVAGMGVAMKANMLIVLVQIGLAAGVQPLFGYCYGAKQYSKLKKAMKFTMLCNIAIGTVVTVLYICFTEPIIRAFINSEEVIGYGVTMLRAIMMTGPYIGIMFVFMFMFQAMGRPLPSLVLSLSRQGFVFLPVLVIAKKLIGLEGIIYAQPIADTGALIIAILIFFFINKQMNKHEAEELTAA